MESVCFTGACPNMTRDELSAMAKGKFEVKSSVTKDLTILVCADPNSGSSKLAKAKKNGTKVISYAEFIEMLSGGSASAVIAESAEVEESKTEKTEESEKIQTALIMANSKVVDGITYSSDMKIIKGVDDKTITKAVIPEGVEAVVMKAFENCTALKEVTIPNSMVDIKKSSFKNCPSLLTVHLSDNVANLSSSWFESLPEQYMFDCKVDSLSYKMIKRSTILKAHVKELALSEAKGEKIKQVQSASIEAVVTTVVADFPKVTYQVLTNRKTGSSVFFQIGKNCGSFKFGTDSTKWIANLRKILEILSDQEKDGAQIYAELKKNKISLADMSTSDGFKMGHINSDADGNVNVFTSGRYKGSWIKAKNTVAFYGVTTLGSSSFTLGGRDDFTNLILTEGLKTIESGAFWNSGHVKSITFPETLEVIERGAFKDCDGFTSIRLPDSLKELGSCAFDNCENLSEIYIPQTIEKLGNFALKGTNIENLGYSLHLKKESDAGTVDVEFTIKDGFAFENDTLVYNTTKKADVKIPDNVTKIGRRAFFYDESVKRVFIPKSVKVIDDEAFYCACSITEINYDGTVAEWEAIEKGKYWNYAVHIETVKCTDGETVLPKVVLQ